MPTGRAERQPCALPGVGGPRYLPAVQKPSPDTFISATILPVKGTENTCSSASMRVSWAVGAIFQVRAPGVIELLKSGSSLALSVVPESGRSRDQHTDNTNKTALPYTRGTTAA